MIGQVCRTWPICRVEFSTDGPECLWAALQLRGLYQLLIEEVVGDHEQVLEAE